MKNSNKVVKQLSVKGKKGQTFFPINGISLALPRTYQIAGKSPVDQSSAFAQATASADEILNVHCKSDQDESTVGVRCYEVKENVHCNTTHTEGIGHIHKDYVTIAQVTEGLENKLMRAALITVTPIKCTADTPHLHPYAKVGDFIITKEAIEIALQQLEKIFEKSINTLIVRCDHADLLEKPHHTFGNPPYFSTGAMQYIVAELEDVGVEARKSNKVNIKHLLTNLPSIDPEKDDGALLCHTTFFGATADRNSYLTTANGKAINPKQRTNSEMLHISRSIADGVYLLKLHVPASNLDHAASIPVLFHAQESQLEFNSFSQSMTMK